MSTVFIHSPPDQYGFIEDPIFQVASATYLSQPCPHMQPIVGRYFGKKGQQLDNGANLAAASLPGQGHSALHNQLQSILQQAMMKLGGIH